MPRKGYKQTEEHKTKVRLAAKIRSASPGYREMISRTTLAKMPGAHGMTGTPVYNSWSTMKQRCLNPNSPKYPNYGGRGITICDRWLRFENFYADMGARPEGTSLDRIDNEGNYEPGNCRWATPAQQVANRRPQKSRRCFNCGMLTCRCGG